MLRGWRAGATRNSKPLVSLATFAAVFSIIGDLRRRGPIGGPFNLQPQCGIGAVNSSLCSSRLISDKKCHGRDVRATSSLNGDMRCEIPFDQSTLRSRRARAAACLMLRDCYSTGYMRRKSPFDSLYGLHSLSEGCSKHATVGDEIETPPCSPNGHLHREGPS